MEGREPTAKAIADLVIALFGPATCREFDECVYDAIRSLGGSLSELQIHELTEKLSSAVRMRINSYIETSDLRGVPPKMSWSSLNAARLVGRSFVSKEDSPEIAKLKRALMTMDEIQRTLPSLSWEEFEILCCGLLLDMRCRDVHRVKPRLEKGIDFYGIYQLTEPEPVRGTIFRVVAQANCFSDSSKVSAALLQKFLLGLKLTEDEPDKLVRILPPHMLDKRHQVRGIYFTSSSFTPDAIRVAEEFRGRLVLVDGEQIAYRIAKSMVAISEIGGIIAFSPDKLLSHIEVLKPKVDC